MTKNSLVIIGLPLILATALLVLQERRATRLEVQIAVLQNQIAAAEANRQDNSRLEEQLKTATDHAEAMDRELARMRSEKYLLQNQPAQAKPERQTVTAL